LTDFRICLAIHEIASRISNGPTVQLAASPTVPLVSHQSNLNCICSTGQPLIQWIDQLSVNPTDRHSVRWTIHPSIVTVNV